MRILRFSLVLSALLAVAPPALADETISVAMSNFAFAPNTLALKSGVPVVLRLTNTGNRGHNFHAPELFAAATLAPPDRAKIADGSVEVEGGETVEVHFTPQKPGTYPFVCTHFLHESFGMKGTATVN
ncbi:MAG: cupredoxin domain-containing protein [Alphaproteobacteria bacterium]|nr:cupredoxin domain-containing protein [Alphaproteobacteria bacterium]MBV9693011.1 cupredoxin domain-containing protein [Alphaproteobacteria bacterium]